MNKIIIINASPRKKWNTAQMCESFAKGAKEAGAEVRTINLYDVDFKGCRSCFACKMKNGKNFGRCAFPDGLTAILDDISQSDGLLLATPIYFGDVTGVMRSFYERLVFPFYQYIADGESLAPKKLKTAVIYTMNCPQDWAQKLYTHVFDNFEAPIEKVFSKPERICSFDTYQFTDYDKYVCEIFDKNEKLKHHETQFPKDLEVAYQSGLRMAK